MSKIDVAKLREKAQQEKAQGGFLGMPIYIDGMKDLQDDVKRLQDIIENQEQYDFDQLKDELTDLNDRLDLETLVTSLEKSILTSQNVNSTHNKDLITKQNEGFSKLSEALKAINIKPQVSVKAVDTVQEYRASDALVSDTTSYYGFVHPTGKWYILRQSGSTSAAFRYVTGPGKYPEAWRGKENLSYKLYNEVTL